jgi:hypothetical protein
MRSTRRKPRRQADPDEAAATESARKNFDAQIQDPAGAFTDVQPQAIRNALHPFEIAGLCDVKPL